MSYPLVLPRDFFNQAKMLKCLGRLSLKVLDGDLHQFCVQDEIAGDGLNFEIEQSSDGYLVCVNYSFFIDPEQPITLCSPYNSKDNFPLLFDKGRGNLERVMDEEGEFTQEFLKFLDFLAKLLNGDSSQRPSTSD